MRLDKDCYIVDPVLAENLRQLTYDLDVSYREFAKLLGRDHRTVNTWLNGFHAMRADDLKEICQTFNISADELLGIKVKGPAGSCRCSLLPGQCSRQLKGEKDD